jgi:uncharacterized ferritin-like protein (DUF455 family)
MRLSDEEVDVFRLVSNALRRSDIGKLDPVLEHRYGDAAAHHHDDDGVIGD